MFFNSITFLVFLVCVLAIQSFGSSTYRKSSMLAASYVFYGFWDWRFCFLIAVTTVTDYTIGRLLNATDNDRTRRRLVGVSLVVNLGILGFFKYADFFIDSFSRMADQFGFAPSVPTLAIILPVGISFYTFQSLSYSIDVYRRRVAPTSSLLDYALYVSFFPQLVAGPIERATHLLPQVENFSGVARSNPGKGLTLIFVGYMKKVLISDAIAPHVDHCFSNYATLPSASLWAGLILFSLQIYFDFSGYTDIARGVARLFGIRLQRNFDQPYFSASFAEFWLRWHRSLSGWLRDYLYIPLGGNRHGTALMLRNLMITMLLGGLWHGASWNFVLWGTLHGIYLCVERLIYTRFSKTRPKEISGRRRILLIPIVYLLTLITWLPFRAPDIQVTIGYLQKMFFWIGGFDPKLLFAAVAGMCGLVVIDVPAFVLNDHCYLLRLPRWLYAAIALAGTGAVLVTMLLHSNNVQPFIYFQF